MAQEWRPLGMDTEDEIADYDALHDGVPDWMQSAYWEWVEKTISITRQGDGYRASPVACVDLELVKAMCQVLQLPLPDLRVHFLDGSTGAEQVKRAMSALTRHDAPLQICDYLLAYCNRAKAEPLEEMLVRSKSAWKVGQRAGKPGLERRVPKGVQDSADSVIARSGVAGFHLAQAWEALYGLASNASEAYRLAIVSVEDAAIPVVSPSNAKATLGSVIGQMQSQMNWRLPMTREPSSITTRDVIIGMMKTLWEGQHDRHGGQPSAPGNVSIDEASVAVNLAVTLVAWFSAGLVREK